MNLELGRRGVGGLLGGRRRVVVGLGCEGAVSAEVGGKGEEESGFVEGFHGCWGSC